MNAEAYIKGCINVAACLIQKDVPTYIPMEMFATLMEQVTRFDEILWGTIQQALALEENDLIISDVEPNFHCDASDYSDADPGLGLLQSNSVDAEAAQVAQRETLSLNAALQRAGREDASSLGQPWHEQLHGDNGCSAGGSLGARLSSDGLRPQQLLRHPPCVAQAHGGADAAEADACRGSAALAHPLEESAGAPSPALPFRAWPRFRRPILQTRGAGGILTERPRPSPQDCLGDHVVPVPPCQNHVNHYVLCPRLRLWGFGTSGLVAVRASAHAQLEQREQGMAHGRQREACQVP